MRNVSVLTPEYFGCPTLAGGRAPAKLVILALAAAMVAAMAAAAEEPTRLLRFPDIHGDRVVFTYAGDLWQAPSGGGSAQRLTSHPGLELFAKFSPDGAWIAFTGQYDGDEQVYVIPAAGGIPRQLTFYPAAGPLPPRWGYDNQVYGWTPDGERVLFRSMRDGWDLADTRLYTVGLDGAMPEPLAMPVSGAGDFSPDGKRVVYSPLVRDFRHWKRYQGGWAQELYLFDLETFETKQITDHPRSDRDPMWIGDTIYFCSDRSGKLAIYAYELATGETRQVTDGAVRDVRWPSADERGRIVFELDGELQLLDTATAAMSALAISVPDDGVARRPSRIRVEDAIEGFGLSPKGERAVFAARGEIFSAPSEHGTTRNLTRSSGAHDREPAWSPDGKRIAFVSDRDGEEEVWVADQAGASGPEQLTDGSTGQKFGLLWAPDSERIAYRDQRGKLYVLEVESRAVTEIADDPAPFGLTYEWSPDSAHLAFTLQDPNGFRSLYLWSAGTAGASSEPRRITDEMFNEFNPVWDPAGDYLFFLSDREFAPQISSFEFDFAVDRETYVYALALRRDVPHPFPPQIDEVEIEGAADDDEDAAGVDETDDSEREEDEEAKEPPVPVRIDFDGLAGRVARVPVDADNFIGLAASEDHLLLLRGNAFYYGRDSDAAPRLDVFTREERELTTLAKTVDGFALSHDGSKVLVQSGSSYTIFDAKPDGADSGKVVSTAGLAMDRVPAEEWAQIFDEVWRRYRDYFYVENMHGYDWAALRDQYRPLLAHVGHRSDLNYVISEMIAELSSSHTYIAGGDWQMPPRPQAGLLGARFDLDATAGRYRISELLPGHNEEPVYRSPLTEVGVEVEPGDYLLAINGQELGAGDNPFRLLRHAGGSPVELTVSDRPQLAGARRVVVDAITSEDDLLYLKWVEANRRKVAEASGGRIGYLHLPDMGGAGIREFIKWFYGQARKEGLIVDVRSNGGGNVSPMIIERLTRELLMVDFERNTDYAQSYPGVVFHGHLACLLDEDTASDGDQFAHAFRAAGLGPLIGKRSWGGVVGIYGRGPLVDGGSVFVPEAGTADPSGRWAIEGHGVDPDIVVENPPKAIIEGRDPQLETAIELVLGEIQRDPRVLPQRPADPVKTQ